MNRLILILWLVLAATSAQAGAWLREKGTGFSATTASVTLAQDIAEDTFIEYGVRDDLTLGLDVRFVQLSTGFHSGAATLFLRRPIGKADRANKWAYELGFGAGWRGPELAPLLRAGLSWGRGFTLRRITGWASADASVIWDVYSNERLFKLDSTLGLNFSERVAGMVQVFHAQTLGVAATSIAPPSVPIRVRHLSG